MAGLMVTLIAGVYLRCGKAETQSATNLPADSLQWLTVYYPTWLQMPLGTGGFGLPPWEIDWSGVTHVVHFDNGNIQKVPPYLSYVVDNQIGKEDSIDLFFNGIANPSGAQVHWADSLISVVHRSGARVVLTLQAVDAANLNYVAEDSARTDVFGEAVIAFLQRHGYDGVELNWEGWITPLASSENINRLVRRLRFHLNKMQPRGLLLVSPSSVHAELYDPHQDALVDQFNLQMYDFAFAWHSAYQSNTSWYLSPLTRGETPFGFEGSSWEARGVNQWVSAGHQRRSIGVLIPSFAVLYRNVSAIFHRIRNEDVAFDLSTSSVLDLKTKGGTAGWDLQRNVPYITGTSTAQVGWPIGLSPGQEFFASFEDEASIQRKIEWARKAGIGGVGMYDLKGDAAPDRPFGQRNFILNAMRKEIHSN